MKLREEGEELLKQREVENSKIMRKEIDSLRWREGEDLLRKKNIVQSLKKLKEKEEKERSPVVGLQLEEYRIVPP